MPVLNITIRWLTFEPGMAAYSGAEWPPSPSRLFRALLAGALRPGGAGQRGVEALQRLEQQPPPVVLTPAPERLEPMRTAVPNNDGDQILYRHHKRNPEQARKKASSLRTMRTRQGWWVPGPVAYRWEFPEADPDPAAFAALADSLTILGQGTDLVTAEAQWTAEEPRRWGYVWRPDESLGVEALPVPSHGEVERLEHVYSSRRRRIRGTRVSSVREPQVRLAGYRDPLSPPPKRWQGFSVRLPDDSAPRPVPGAEAMRLAGMVRHAVHRAAKTAGLDEATIAELMGHGGDGRLFVLPVPNVAHAYADGRIRRVLVAAPPAVRDAVWRAVTLRLTAAELIDEDTGESEGLLAPITKAREDRILWRFTEPTTGWCSATPVILPGFDTRRGRARPEKSARRLLKHAGIRPEAVRHIRLDDAPRVPGVCAGPRIEVPHYLDRYPRKFLTVEFHRPVPGPLVLGAGEGVGIGLLTHGEHRSGDSHPGGRSQRENARQDSELAGEGAK